jgi:hypothetical protein
MFSLFSVKEEIENAKIKITFSSCYSKIKTMNLN